MHRLFTTVENQVSSLTAIQAQSGRGIWLWEERISELKSVGWGKPYPFDDGTVALIGVQEIVS